MWKEEFINYVKFDDKGLVPAVVQDMKGIVLMLAYMNREALRETLAIGKMCYYSRSRQKLWFKGEKSGNQQTVREVYLDCDGDTLLFKVEQKTAACHLGYYSCFFRKIDRNGKLKVTEKKVFNPERVYEK
jgi:phosphoribosyl-AMP cyclohydrolase